MLVHQREQEAGVESAAQQNSHRHVASKCRSSRRDKVEQLLGRIRIRRLLCERLRRVNYTSVPRGIFHSPPRASRQAEVSHALKIVSGDGV